MGGNPELLKKYLAHAKQNKIVQDYVKPDFIMDMPICPKCERVGIRDRGWITDKIMRCPHCGYHGKTTMIMAGYLKEGLYK